MSEPRLSRPPDLRLPCPDCGPHCRDPRNRTRKVLGIWHRSDGSWSSWCIRCGHRNFSLTRAEQSAFARTDAACSEAARAKRAAWLWSCALPAKGTPVETYLQNGRGLASYLPNTLRYLPARGRYPHAMIAAFGPCEETEPGRIVSPNVVDAVHLTRLSPDGSARESKIMVGPIRSLPIVIAPPNDGLGLVIAEGIEDALSLHQATGLGAWAAGSAGHMAKLAASVPSYLECVTIAEDDNGAGHKAACQLEVGLISRGIEARRVRLHEA